MRKADWLARSGSLSTKSALGGTPKNLLSATYSGSLSGELHGPLVASSSTPKLKKALADLERLDLVRATLTEFSFAASLHELPDQLQAHTDRILKTLGHDGITRAIRVPRRLMLQILGSRCRPLRTASIFVTRLRIMPVRHLRVANGMPNDWASRRSVRIQRKPYQA